MSQNYNSTEVGVPYARVPRLTIDYSNNLFPRATIEQSLAVKLKDGTIHEMGRLPELFATFDMATDGTKPIPLIDPTTGTPLGVNTNLQQIMLSILAVVRQEQLRAEQ